MNNPVMVILPNKISWCKWISFFFFFLSKSFSEKHKKKKKKVIRVLASTFYVLLCSVTFFPLVELFLGSQFLKWLVHTLSFSLWFLGYQSLG